MAARAAAMANARLSDVSCRTTNRAVQIHGAIGFTWEHDLHQWFKHPNWNETAFGDAAFHRERAAGGLVSIASGTATERSRRADLTHVVPPTPS